MNFISTIKFYKFAINLVILITMSFIFSGCDKSLTNQCVASGETVFKILSKDMNGKTCTLQVMHDFQESSGQEFKKGLIFEESLPCKVYHTNWNQIECPTN